jgi:hypothetical protein
MKDHPIDRWSGSLPLVCSVIALIMVMHGYGEFRRHGPPKDEGGAEHVFFLAMLLQLPLIACFGFSMRRELMRALPVLSTQIVLWVFALAAGMWCPGFH